MECAAQHLDTVPLAWNAWLAQPKSCNDLRDSHDRCTIMLGSHLDQALQAGEPYVLAKCSSAQHLC